MFWCPVMYIKRSSYLLLLHLQIIDINKKVFITVEMLYVVLVTLYNRSGFILIIDINKMRSD